MKKLSAYDSYWLVYVLVLVTVALLSACNRSQEVVEVTRIVEEERQIIVTGEPIVERVTRVVVEEVVVTPTPSVPIEAVTGRFVTSRGVYFFDPQLSTDGASSHFIKNMFAHLTSFDPATAEVIPETATAWEISDDGLTYTFDIRTDIPWVRHNPISGETVQEVDSDGNPRFVTAHDFAFSIRRACHPEHGGQASISIAPLIKGCDETLYIENLDDFSAEMLDAIGVSAPSDDTLIIELEEPAGYFLSITPSKLLAASPEWAIDDNGDDWWKPGLIVSSGNYVLHEYISGIRTKLWRNPLMPQDMRGSGNIEHIVTNVVPDINTAYALWLNGEIEEAFLPEGELANHSETYPDETVFSSTLAVDFFGFRMDKPPFDNPDVRRAFSAGYDREAHIEVLLEGQGLPMRHFAPPGIFGAPPLNEVGVGTNIAYAKERLAAAGYPDCEGFPPIVILTYDGEWPVKQAEFAQTQWSENLGCDSDQIEIQQLQFIEMLSELEDADPTAAPHIFTLGWGADYADENNWVGDMLACKGFNTSKRPCDEIDDMIVAARVEANQQVRVDNYRQIEEAFFGEDGSFPIMPVTVIMATWAKRSWLDSIYSQLGGNQWYNWTIDQEAQLAARND